jgi:threonine dehydrogenase-like Zn-dependent dehydrogenase
MKAARLVERRKPLELTDLPDPVPGPGEVVIEVEAEGICRTDWHVWNGDWDWVGLTPDLPLVMGHELGGTVVAVGAGVSRRHVDYPRLLWLVATGVLRPARIVGQTLPLEQASAVLDAMDSYETLGFSVITGF